MDARRSCPSNYLSLQNWFFLFEEVLCDAALNITLQQGKSVGMPSDPFWASQKISFLVAHQGLLTLDFGQEYNFRKKSKVIILSELKAENIHEVLLFLCCDNRLVNVLPEVSRTFPGWNSFFMDIQEHFKALVFLIRLNT